MLEPFSPLDGCFREEPMVRIRTAERTLAITEKFYACEECGKEYPHMNQAEYCEKKHVRDRCPHASQEWVPDPDGDGIDRTCPALPTEHKSSMIRWASACLAQRIGQLRHSKC
jgi:hypothetical protein